ncbi:MAG: 5-(carboxyamino)imidazole ribonucleotide synthase [Alphaproteobacteria bacterium]|jgi:5-(carboxyamino)imidazole ribonucleotide synthase|nr:5-(carboxyamino)imidazole ribonucleotide synthase [Alphaproteobacteria bacterium]
MTSGITFPHTACIGILGGGQLGRMLAIAAAQLGLQTHVFAPDAATSPAGQVATLATTADYDDVTALRHFAASVDAVTSEFENVPAATMEVIGASCLASPGAAALRAAQHRIAEKSLAAELGIATPRFWHIRNDEDLASAMQMLDGPAILKTCRLGYDGKGQRRITPGDDLAAAFTELASDDVILEEMIAFDSEISALLARDANGAMCHFPVTLNNHRNGILATSVAPAPVSASLAEAAQTAAAALAGAVDLVGLLAVEFFVDADGGLLFNEMAPRPHNSFHWTIEGCATSQFTQLARVLAGMGFGATTSYGSWQMENLLGQDMARVPSLLASAGAHLHLYGKPEARTDRKMGHVTSRLGD